MKQTKQKLNHDKSAPVHRFQIETVVRIRGPLTNDIEREDGRIVTRHVDNLRMRYPQPTSTSSSILHPNTEDDCLPTPAASSGCSTDTQTTNSAAVPLRRSTRLTHPPNRYL